MILLRVIREPTSLLDAELEYERQIKRAGCVIVSDMKSYWQPNLFRDTPDAIVEANVECIRKGK